MAENTTTAAREQLPQPKLDPVPATQAKVDAHRQRFPRERVT